MNNIGIVGAGTMGAGIMIGVVISGRQVTLVDHSQAALDRAVARLQGFLKRQVQKGRISAHAQPGILARLRVATDMAALSECSLVIEAVFEELALKRNIFDAIELEVSAETILASNTSCLRLADIAAALRHPGRFCGMHYFSPAEINPVVELVTGPLTSAKVLSSAQAFLRETGKEVITCQDQYGFALNRFFCPYTNEAVHVLDEGLASVGQIDEVAKATFDLTHGPFAVMNIIGTATNLNAVRNLAALGPFYSAAKGLVTQGSANNPWVIEPKPQQLDNESIRLIKDRLKLSVLLPVIEELAEGTADLEAIDRGASLAFRFGKTPGKLISETDLETLQSKLSIFAISRGQKPLDLNVIFHSLGGDKAFFG